MQKQNNIPQMRFPEFKGEWEKKKLGDITFKTDKKNKNKEILPVYSISNKFGFIPQSEQFDGIDSNERGYDTSLYKIIENNTFAYNPARINVGSIGYNENLGRVIVSSLYVCFQTKENIDDNFLFHFFNTTKFNNSVLTNGEGGVRIYLFYENFSSIPFSIPSLPEQKKIASFINVIDKKISELKQKKNLLEQYKKGVMQKIFTQELRFKDDKGKDFPKWNETIMGEVAAITTGNKDTQNRIEDGKYPFFVRSQTIEKINSFSFDGEAILTSGDGVGVGKNFHYIVGKFDFHQRVYCLNNFKSGVFGKYIFYFFSENFNKRIMRMSAKNSVDSIRRDMIFDMPVSLPTQAEQIKIANFFSVLDEKINRTEIQLEKTEAYKKGLSQNMFC